MVDQMPIVKLANGTTFAVSQDKNLLSEARSKGIALEYSCRTGRCGVCKAQVVSGDTRIIQREDALSSDEMNSGVILTCCRAAVTDVTLNVSDLGRLGEVKTKTMPCRIDSIQQLTPTVIHVILRLPPGSKLFYLPGQYIDVINNGLRRSYSIANAPRHDGKLELQISRVEQGVMSNYWFNGAQVNDLLRLEGPLGTFCLRTIEPENIVFLATGTGIAPVKAILEELDLSPELIRGKHIHVYWGGRAASDIHWRVTTNSVDVRFVPVLSRPCASWVGRTGYVQQALVADRIDLRSSVVYACGSDAMIHSARTLLESAGLQPESFYSDAFVSSN